MSTTRRGFLRWLSGLAAIPVAVVARAQNAPASGGARRQAGRLLAARDGEPGKGEGEEMKRATMSCTVCGVEVKAHTLPVPTVEDIYAGIICLCCRGGVPARLLGKPGEITSRALGLKVKR